MPVYRKIDNPDWRLMYYSFRKEWIVQQTSGKGTDNGRAYFKCVPPCLPENGPKGTWQVITELQLGVDITTMTMEEVAAAIALPEALAASLKAHGRKVCVCVCACVCILVSLCA